ncbi:uncharacterized protein SPPG_05007 [Spizellomyces punctatus DAOM BR117]|uniref:Uncharacterized protein n=1 Tax=Spizellomyces punctatus (strain DAOM BR117) TaxID=645134 RepID=A0A0L0HF25_SPIPD|nr:uncharacterized protein SPPG_05007 [Spizellomyces punctatus DAOM BR117]KNC99621.1 hypothetical protein SPPG_05007 [Spizellomyces punctatus DAOM BR117]|eukprot:XP_016607661.1 hypothetical protein SPPG_05007 [Spizellomyces punctatus DAOM BR117]
MFASTPQGVRAQAKSLRAPSAISSIASYLNGISSYVAQNLSEKSPSTEFDPLDPSERVLSAAFCWVDWENKRQLCLFLGYGRGFQVWSLGDLENVREVVSVREGLRKVTWVEALPTPYRRDGSTDYLEHARPLIAYITEVVSEDSSGKPQSALQLYSLRSLTAVQTVKFGEDTALEAKCNARVIAVSLASHAIHIYSALTLHLLGVYTDTRPNPLNNAIVYDIGSRYIIYATSTPPPPSRRKGTSTDELPSDPDSDDADGIPDAGLARKVAGKVAKDLVVGAKVIGEYGYQALSNYFSPATKEGVALRAEEDVKVNGTPGGKVKENGKLDRYAELPSGVVVIRPLPTPTSPSSNSSTTTSPQPHPPSIAHWKPHTNPVSVIAFNPNQTLVITASSQANTFYIWQVPGRSSKGKPRTAVQCLYKLERGYTMATIESVAFSVDSKWVGVTTTRGTTHVYRINPASMKEKSLNGMNGERLNIINGFAEPKQTQTLVPGTAEGGIASLYPVARIKRQPVEASPKSEAWSEGVVSNDSITCGSGRAPLIAAFLPDKNALKDTAAAVYDRRSHDRSSPVGSAGTTCGGSWTHTQAEAPVSAIRLFRQRLLTFHPTDRGSLMMHHVDVLLEDPTPASPQTLLPSPKRSSTGASPSSFDRFSPSGLFSAFPGLGFGGKKQHIRVKVSEVMEWNVKREMDWGEVKRSVQTSPSRPPAPTRTNPTQTPTTTTSTTTAAAKSSPPSRIQWPSKIEIVTHETAPRPPVWMGPQFCFQVFDASRSLVSIEPNSPDLSDLPAAFHVQIRREAPKPYGDDKTLVPNGQFPVLGGDEKFQEGISTAMGSFIQFPDEDTVIPNGGDRDSLSFEDAYHIHIVARRHGFQPSETGSLSCDEDEEAIGGVHPCGGVVVDEDEV